MKFRSGTFAVFAFLGGVTFGVLFFGQLPRAAAPLASAHAEDPPHKPDVATVSQALAMTDVDYHSRNLWFAGSQQNWPLANYYWKETLINLRRAVHINPTHKDATGREVKLTDILQSIENAPHMNIGDAIQKQDPIKFASTYRNLMEGCYHCHKQAERAFLRPKVPQPPAASIINFDPKAAWPK
jgi:hypothetical protein